MKKLIVFTLVISNLILSCTKTSDGIPGPAGAAGMDGLSASQSRSAITGFVRLKDQFGNPDSSFNQVTVSTRMGDSLISILTDNSGKFILPNLKSGNYRILLQKANYDSIAYNVVHSAGNEDKFIGNLLMIKSLSDHFISQDLILSPSPFDPAYNILTVTTTITDPLISNSTHRVIHIYFSKSPTVGVNNYLYELDGNSSGLGINYMVTYVGFQSSDINDINFNQGDTVYVKTYFAPYNPLLLSWFDTNTYQTISYPYLGDSLKNFFIWTN